MVLGGKRYKNVGVRCADRRPIAVGEFDAAVGQADVVDDVMNFARRNFLSNRLLDKIAKVSGFFNTHSGWSAPMTFHSAVIAAGTEIPAQPGNQNCQSTEPTREEGNQEKIGRAHV